MDGFNSKGAPFHPDSMVRFRAIALAERVEKINLFGFRLKVLEGCENLCGNKSSTLTAFRWDYRLVVF